MPPRSRYIKDRGGLLFYSTQQIYCRRPPKNKKLWNTVFLRFRSICGIIIPIILRKGEKMGSFKRSLPYAFSFAAAIFMVMAAELIGDNEIIFPEITAVAIGALAAPKRAWNTSRLRLFLTISAAAFLGVGIVRFVPLPLVFQVPLGLVCVLTLVTLSGTEFIPAVSACVLPILMGTESVVYIISVAVMVGMILLMQVILEKLGVREKYDFHPVEISRRLLKLRIKQAVIASLLCALPAIFHEPFFSLLRLLWRLLNSASQSQSFGQKAMLSKLCCLLLLRLFSVREQGC